MCDEILIPQSCKGCAPSEIMEYAVVLYLHQANQSTRNMSSKACYGTGESAELVPVTMGTPVIGPIRSEIGIQTGRIGYGVK